MSEFAGYGGKTPPRPEIRETGIPKTRFGTPDFNAMWQELQDLKHEARESQERIIALLNEIRGLLAPEAGSEANAPPPP